MDTDAAVDWRDRRRRRGCRTRLDSCPSCSGARRRPDNAVAPRPGHSLRLDELALHGADHRLSLEYGQAEIFGPPGGLVEGGYLFDRTSGAIIVGDLKQSPYLHDLAPMVTVTPPMRRARG